MAKQYCTSCGALQAKPQPVRQDACPFPRTPRNAAGGFKVTGLHAAKPPKSYRTRIDYYGASLQCKPNQCGHFMPPPSTLRAA